MRNTWECAESGVIVLFCSQKFATLDYTCSLVLPDPLPPHHGEHRHGNRSADPGGHRRGHAERAAPAPDAPQVLHPEGGSLGLEQRGCRALPTHPAADWLRHAASLGGSTKKCEWCPVCPQQKAIFQSVPC